MERQHLKQDQQLEGVGRTRRRGRRSSYTLIVVASRSLSKGCSASSKSTAATASHASRSSCGVCRMRGCKFRWACFCLELSRGAPRAMAFGYARVGFYSPGVSRAGGVEGEVGCVRSSLKSVFQVLLKFGSSVGGVQWG